MVTFFVMCLYFPFTLVGAVNVGFCSTFPPLHLRSSVILAFKCFILLPLIRVLYSSTSSSFFCHFLSYFRIIHGEFPVLFFPESLVFEMHACGLETAQSVLIDFPLSILQFFVVVVSFQFNSFHLMDVISQPSPLR